MRPAPTLLSTLAALALLSPGAARALDAKEAGEISAEVEAKQQAVKAEYGNRSWREMSQEERKDYEKKMNGARDQVLNEHGTSQREYETTKLKMGREGLKSSEEAKAGWAEKKKKEEAAKKAEAEKKKDGPQEVKVQRGFDDKNPVDLEGNADTATEENGVKVQRGGGSEGIDIPVAPEGGAAEE